MAEYIEREALRAKAVYMHGFGENKYVPLKAIENAPAADVEVVKHGRWLSAYEYAIKLGVTDTEMLRSAKEDKWWKFCNDCEQQVKGYHNYCPNCGAKMMEVDDG